VTLVVSGVVEVFNESPCHQRAHSCVTDVGTVGIQQAKLGRSRRSFRCSNEYSTAYSMSQTFPIGKSLVFKLYNLHQQQHSLYVS
jgi:hypothetical protein